MSRIKLLFLLALLSGNSNAITLCGNYDAVNIGNYRVSNNVWNDSTGTQCLDVDATTGAWNTQSGTHNKPLNGPPAAYPFTLVGCHWGSCSAGNPFPRQISGLNGVLGYLGTTIVGAGTYNAAYDIWINKTPTTSGQPDGQEIMVWLNYSIGIQPVGVLVETKQILKSMWQVWHGGNVTTYKKLYGTDGTLMDLKYFVNDSIVRGYVNPAWYMIGVEWGFEIWQGQPGLYTNIFTLTVN